MTATAMIPDNKINDSSLLTLSSCSESKFRRRLVGGASLLTISCFLVVAVLGIHPDDSLFRSSGLFRHRSLLFGKDDDDNDNGGGDDGNGNACTCKNGGTGDCDNGNTCTCPSAFGGPDCGARIVQDLILYDLDALDRPTTSPVTLGDGTVSATFSNYLPPYARPVLSSVGIELFADLQSFDVVFNQDAILKKYSIWTRSNSGARFTISGSNGKSGSNDLSQEGIFDLDMGTIPAFLKDETYTFKASIDNADGNSFFLEVLGDFDQSALPI